MPCGSHLGRVWEFCVKESSRFWVDPQRWRGGQSHGAHTWAQNGSSSPPCHRTAPCQPAPQVLILLCLGFPFCCFPPLVFYTFLRPLEPNKLYFRRDQPILSLFLSDQIRNSPCDSFSCLCCCWLFPALISPLPARASRWASEMSLLQELIVPVCAVISLPRAACGQNRLKWDEITWQSTPKQGVRERIGFHQHAQPVLLWKRTDADEPRQALMPLWWGCGCLHGFWWWLPPRCASL